MPRKRLKRIHVNQHIIRRNRKESAGEPPLTVKVSRENLRAHRVEIHGPAEVLYSPDRPLPCGATVWIETRSPVAVHLDSDTRVIS
jgi:hypothetical protein